jgi:hypothetical protein
MVSGLVVKRFFLFSFNFVAPRERPYLPNLEGGLEVETYVEYTWHIQSFQTLRNEALTSPGRKVYSPEFLVGNEKWYSLTFK